MFLQIMTILIWVVLGRNVSYFCTAGLAYVHKTEILFQLISVTAIRFSCWKINCTSSCCEISDENVIPTKKINMWEPNLSYHHIFNLKEMKA